MLKVDAECEVIAGVPPELNALMEISSKYCKAEKAERIHSLLNSDFTLESTKFTNGLTALHVACAKNDHELIRILLDRGSNPEVSDFKKKKPRDYTRDLVSLKELGILRIGQKPCENR